jgi:oligopeptide transport system ATP-binding protein
VVRHIADCVAVMYLGRIVELSTKRALFAAPRHPYTQGLLSAIPLPEPRDDTAAPRARLLLPGDVPSPLAPPPGCHFHTRCAFAVEHCTRVAPPLLDDGAGHATACHRWREIVPPGVLRDASARSATDVRLARLQSAFVH